MIIDCPSISTCRISESVEFGKYEGDEEHKRYW